MSARLRGARVLGAAGVILLVLTRCAGTPSTPGRSAILLPRSATALPQYDPQTFQRLLTQLHGQPAVVNVWASWCGPCVTEAPGLSQVSRAFEGRVQFVGVDVLDQRGAAQEFVRRFHWGFPSVFDPTASIRNSLGFLGQPVTVIFDSKGRRVFVSAGALKSGQLREEVSDALGR